MRPIIKHISRESGYLSHHLFGFSYFPVLSLILLLMVSSGCEDRSPAGPETDHIVLPTLYDGSDIISRVYFDIKGKYLYIRSQPGGGGVFIVRMVRGRVMSDDYSLSIQADAGLNASIDIDGFSGPSGVAEISVRPDESIDAGIYSIRFYATDRNITRAIEMNVDVINWPAGTSEMAMDKRDEFVTWLETEHPELGNFSRREWYSYLTYPGILQVEHWTFLDQDWEMRICFHVMIPPYDWSMLLIRPRGEWDALLAARRESDGTIYEIPLDEYPTFYSY